jgi:hypothetical protein
MLLLFCLIEQLQTPLHLRQPEVVISLVSDCFQAIRLLLEPIPSSSFDRLEALYSFATREGFINFFHQSTEIDLERMVILTSLLAFMAPYQSDCKQITDYLKDQLQRRRRELAYLLSRPVLASFLRRTDTFQLYQEWLYSLRETKRGKEMEKTSQLSPAQTSLLTENSPSSAIEIEESSESELGWPIFFLLP